MRRRDFMYLLGAGSLSAAMANNTVARATLEALHRREEMTAGDLHRYLRSLFEVPEPSADQILVGDPERVITKAGTTWMGYWRACRKAVEAGINALVVHEPIFYSTRDLGAKDARYRRSKRAEAAYEKLIAAKRRWLEDQGLTIIRCHDVMDRVGGFGMSFALGEAMGFGSEELLRSQPCYKVYRVEPRPASELAQHIADRLKAWGQPGVAFYGDPHRMVASVGVGTGCICDPIQFAPLEPDLFVAIDDKVNTWIQTTYAEDSGHPLVVINHGSSEEPGMKALCGHLSAAFPKLEFTHIGDGCSYRWFAADRGRAR